MTTYALNRGEASAIPFTINDPGNGLTGMRVTYAFALGAGGTRVLRKVGALPGSSADITILTQSASQITGTVNVNVGDYTTLTEAKYVASLWVDDNNGNDRCIDVLDNITIIPTVSRQP